MLKNYLLITIRTIFRHKMFSFINIFSLALSMCVCMMVMIRIKDQFSYDTFHRNADRIYRITSQAKNKNADIFRFASTPLPLQNEIKEYDVIEDLVNLYPAIGEKASFQAKTLHVNASFTQPSFLSVFGFRLENGNPATALQSPNSIILTKETADKFFNNENPIGKLLSFENAGSFVVTGVLKETGEKSHIDYDAYISASSIPVLEKSGKLPGKLNNWNSFHDSYTYVLLNKNATPAQLQKQLDVIGAEITRQSKDGSFSFHMQPLTKITPSKDELLNDIGRGGSWGKILAETGIALLILIAACFNYTNLTIARALTRAKEIGIRKVSGASRYQVFTQYIVESVVIAIFALLLSVLFLSFILDHKPFNDGYEMIPALPIDATVALLFLAFSVLTGIIAGAIPAWILSAFKTVNILKNLSTHKLFGNISLYKSLIVFQYSLSLVVIIFLSSFNRQFSYMAIADPGFRRENVLVVPLENSEVPVLINEIKRISGVENLTALSENFGRHASGTMLAKHDKKSDRVANIDYYYSDSGLVSTMDLKLLAGNNFSSSNDPHADHVLINSKAAEALGLPDNYAAVGKDIWLDDSTHVVIEGVLHDFYHRGVGIDLRPIAIINNPKKYNYLNIYSVAADKERLVSDIEAVYKRIYPGKSFTYSWLDKQIESSYDQHAGISLLGFLGLITVTIASLGLLGLVIYTVETKRKEICIRKVIGAGVQRLMRMLSKGFINLLLIAGLIATPIGYLLSRLFLQNFAKRITIGPIDLLACFFLLLAIGLITILSQTFRAATENPVKNLRNE